MFFCHLGLYRGVLLWYLGVFTACRSHRYLRDPTAMLCFGFIFRMYVSTHETREDSFISASRTLEAHSRGLSRSSTLTSSWIRYFKMAAIIFASQRLISDDWVMVVCRPLFLFAVRV